MKDAILFAIGVWGETLGLLLVILVSVWDLLILGLRSFVEYRIGFIGIVVIWIAIFLIVASKHLDKNFK